MWLLLIAVALVGAGALVGFWRSRQGRRGTILAAALLLSVAGVGASAIAPTGDAHAAPGNPCSLVKVADIRHGDAADIRNLLPGQTADIVTFTVTNVTTYPITMTSSLVATGGSPNLFRANIITDAATSASGVLSGAVSSAPMTIPAGTAVSVTVSAGPVPDLTSSGVDVSFDAVVTATGP